MLSRILKENISSTVTSAEETEWGLPYIVQMVLNLSPFYTHVTGADGSMKHLYDYFHDIAQLTRYIIRKIICLHVNQGWSSKNRSINRITYKCIHVRKISANE